MNYLSYVAKAFYAGVVTALTGAIAANTDGYTQAEILTITLGTVVAVGGVFGLTNGPKPAGTEDAGQDDGS